MAIISPERDPIEREIHPPAIDDAAIEEIVRSQKSKEAEVSSPASAGEPTEAGIEDIKKEALRRFQEAGFFREDETGLKIVDLEKFRGADFKTIRALLPKEQRKWRDFGDGAIDVLYSVFSDLSVISEDDYKCAKKENKKPQTQPLFYAPNSRAEAFSQMAIRDAEFYLAPWELGVRPKRRNEPYPGLGEKSQASHFEVSLALVLYHPRFGDAIRDEARLPDGSPNPNRGKLLIRHAQTRHYIPLSIEHLKERYGFGMPRPKRNAGAGIMRARLETIAPHLVRTGLLTPEDIRMATAAGGKLPKGEKFSLESLTERLRQPVFGVVGKNGFVMVARSPTEAPVRYYLGRRLGGMRWEKVSEDLAVVLRETEEGEEAPEYIWQLRDPKELTYEYTTKQGNRYKLARKSETNLRSIEKFAQRRDDEKEEEFKRRVAILEEWKRGREIVLEFVRRNIIASPQELGLEKTALFGALAKKIGRRHLLAFAELFGADGVDVLAKMEYSPKLCDALLALEGEIPLEKSRKFLRQFGEEGFRVFVSLGRYSREFDSAIFSIGEYYQHEEALAIFRAFNGVANATRNIERFIIERFAEQQFAAPELTEEVADRLLRRAKNTLAHYGKRAETAKGSAPEGEAPNIVKQLEHVEYDTMLFGASFAAAVERGLIKSPEDIRGTELRTLTPEELQGDKIFISEMEQIFMDNRETYPQKAREAARASFLEGIRKINGLDRTFFVLVHRGKVIGFFRLDQRDSGNFYAASFNVRPETRGFGIGTHLLGALLERHSSRADIEAEVYAKNPMLKHYIDDFGFEIAGEIPDWNGTGELFYKIIRRRKPAAQETAKETAAV